MTLFFTSNNIGFSSICLMILGFTWIVTSANRSIPVAVAIYRFKLVFSSSKYFTRKAKKQLQKNLIIFITGNYILFIQKRISISFIQFQHFWAYGVLSTTLTIFTDTAFVWIRRSRQNLTSRTFMKTLFLEHLTNFLYLVLSGI